MRISMVPMMVVVVMVTYVAMLAMVFMVSVMVAVTIKRLAIPTPKEEGQGRHKAPHEIPVGNSAGLLRFCGWL